MIEGVTLVPNHHRTVVKVSRVERDLYVIEPMHFLTPAEARNQARAASALLKPRRPFGE